MNNFCEAKWGLVIIITCWYWGTTSTCETLGLSYSLDPHSWWPYNSPYLCACAVALSDWPLQRRYQVGGWVEVVRGSYHLRGVGVFILIIWIYYAWTTVQVNSLLFIWVYQRWIQSGKQLLFNTTFGGAKFNIGVC